MSTTTTTHPLLATSAERRGFSTLSADEQVQLALALEASGLDNRAREEVMDRVTHGYARRDLWDASGFLSGVVANMLYHYATTGTGHDMGNFYAEAEDPLTARKEDMLRIANIFANHWVGDTWDNADSAEKYGGVTQEQLREALAWLVERYEYLWD